MTKKEFYQVYIPALEKALDTDHVNLGFNVKGPEDYIDPELQVKLEKYLEKNEDNFLEKVAYYFDAKSHNFPSIGETPIEVCKVELVNEIHRIKAEFIE
ncbi:hypothetical protein [Aquimarina algiphila]|uniref:Uncharacterized protein n=1 Tax=Aquimarina algiphila TaxID=2047982 RepID=A0A554VAZ1_9FLAO|nr:hypothetical protein [Aquimarina algiphila]TSE03484.1 hypothetical protein FOF46_29135 [Aquimarina algiphila]